MRVMLEGEFQAGQCCRRLLPGLVEQRLVVVDGRGVGAQGQSQPEIGLGLGKVLLLQMQGAAIQGRPGKAWVERQGTIIVAQRRGAVAAQRQGQAAVVVANRAGWGQRDAHRKRRHRLVGPVTFVST